MAISLAKGGSLSLKKDDGSNLTTVTLGLGWDEVKQGGLRGLFGGGGGGGAIDLDASAILFDSRGSLVEIVYYGQLKSSDGSVRHSGDNLTGAGEGDDEQIVVDLARIPATVKTVVFTINSYSGQTFNQIKNVFARVVDSSAGKNTEVVRYNLAESKNDTANIIAKITRQGSEWVFSAIGEFTNGKTASKVVDTASRFL
jgi:tellurium resistance protein TerZ